jgi:hypothetical protein
MAKKKLLFCVPEAYISTYHWINWEEKAVVSWVPEAWLGTRTLRTWLAREGASEVSDIAEERTTSLQSVHAQLFPNKKKSAM